MDSSPTEASFADRFAVRRAAASDVAACRTMLRENSRTFFAASLLLPPNVREPATALYAFCRLADDAVDLNGGQPHAVQSLMDRLDRLYAGRPINDPADRAFAHVVDKFDIPRALPDALLEGFLWDANSRRYDDLEGIFDYSARVAGTVGAMMSLLMGVRSVDALARATDLGVAMQISNIARDVGEDARNGRLYLPRNWMRDAGIDADEWLRQPVFSAALASVVQRLLKAGDDLYNRIDSGVAVLPRRCQPGINAARFLYAEIGREVEKAGCDSMSRRATVPASRKATLLAAAMVTSTSRSSVSDPALPACQYLIDAVAATGNTANAPAAKSMYGPWGIYDRVGWLIELFERLERLDRSHVEEGSSSISADQRVPAN